MKSKKIGEIIKVVDERNDKNEELEVLGIKKNKTFFPTIADLTNVDTSDYKIINKNYFACNLIHVGRDAVLPVALMTEDSKYMVSKAYKTFIVNEDSGVTPEYLMLFFQNDEFDRFLWFISDVGIRGELKWEKFLEIPVPLPNKNNVQEYLSESWLNLRSNIDNINRIIKIQKKFISNYFANIAINSESKRLGEYIEIEKIYNTEKKYNTADVKGIAITKEFIKTKANLSNVDITKYQIVNTKSFAFATNTSRMGDKLAIALNRGAPILVSQIYPVFKITKPGLVEEYLLSWFNRDEFDRYARFHSWGSAREVFSFNDMEDISIPIPSKDIQMQLGAIRKSIDKLEKIKINYETLIRELSPITNAGLRKNII